MSRVFPELTTDERQACASRLESDTANLLDGRLTPGSGSKSQKGDVVAPGKVRVECKWSGHHDAERWLHPVQAEWLVTIATYAERTHQTPLLALEWGSGARACFAPWEEVKPYLLQRPCYTVPFRTLEKRIEELPEPEPDIQVYHWAAIEQAWLRDWALLPWEQLPGWLRLRTTPTVTDPGTPGEATSDEEKPRFRGKDGFHGATPKLGGGRLGSGKSLGSRKLRR